MDGNITSEINRAKLLGVEVYETSETFKGNIVFTKEGFQLSEKGVISERPKMFLDDIANRFSGKKVKMQIRVVVEL